MSTGLSWVKGMESPNPAGRKKGSKRNYMKTLERFIARNGSLKDLEGIFNHLSSQKEQLEMLRAVWFYTLPRPIANAISEEEQEQLLERTVKMQQYIKQLENQIKDNGLELQRKI